MTDGAVTAAAARRGRLVISLLVSCVAVCVTVPVVVVLTGPVAGGWDETLGFVAGLLVACAGIAVSLRFTGSGRP